MKYYEVKLRVSQRALLITTEIIREDMTLVLVKNHTGWHRVAPTIEEGYYRNIGITNIHRFIRWNNRHIILSAYYISHKRIPEEEVAMLLFSTEGER